MSILKNSIFFIFLLFLSNAIFGQHGAENSLDNEHIKGLLNKYKKDVRGPYKMLNWYCNDGRINPAKEPCGDEVGGVQRATYKDEVIALGKSSHVYLGQILATTDFDEFWDKRNFNSRLKQYQLEKYLKSVDDGWVNRRAQYYRGALQSEDEESWGKEFFNWLLEDDDILISHFFLVREAAKDIPHAGDDNVAQLMRSQSKVIADEHRPFMKLRIKIHGQPEPSDIESVLEFKSNNSSELTPELKKKIDQLVVTMRKYFKPIDINQFRKYTSTLLNQEIKSKLNNFIETNKVESIQELIVSSSDIMWYIRANILNEPSSSGRLSLLDLSIKLEDLIKTQIGNYPDDSLDDLLNKICYLSTASAAAGFTEIWEWDTLLGDISKMPNTELTLEQLNTVLIGARKQLEWGTGKNRAIFQNVISLYEGFEPMVHGFLDDRIRGSISLSLGNSIGKLGNFITNKSSLNNKVLDLTNQSHVHGLNPGYARGKLMVIDGSAENLDVSSDNIYVFDTPPSDLKPIAGILTVSEGNLVSHVQLLARNLGIPNSAVSSDNVSELKKYNGQEVFYAVSVKGNVLIKTADKMSEVERGLFNQEVRDEDMITIPTDEIKLDNAAVLNMRAINAKSSGIYCGPKAANLGELKELYPDHVVEGLVIPFAVFLDHMKEPIPGKEISYWDFLNSTFKTARDMKSKGSTEKALEDYQLGRLEQLRGFIKDMRLKQSFLKDLDNSFVDILGSPLGETAVFLRSDTNMEDLKNFTGAGLNLTLFNVVNRQKILDGIKAVWASPYTERSFKWRQKYLTNPENVYPSILVIPSVDNDYSGVMITKGVISGKDDEITVAFSKGVGGAVDGQAAETWVLRENRNYKLISPARDVFYNSLPSIGGTKSNSGSFEKSILSRKNRDDLFELSQTLISKMQQKNIEGPYDVELGFKDDKIWLFQVRPFVENKNAKSSVYLESIAPMVDMNMLISLNTKIQ